MQRMPPCRMLPARCRMLPRPSMTTAKDTASNLANKAQGHADRMPMVRPRLVCHIAGSTGAQCLFSAPTLELISACLSGPASSL